MHSFPTPRHHRDIYRQHKKRFLLLMLLVFLLTACTTVAKFGDNEAVTLVKGHSIKTTLNVKNWHATDQLVLLPGGPYPNQKILLPVAGKLVGKTSQHIIVVDESNELRVLDFSTTPAKQLAQLTLSDKANTLAIDNHQIYVGFENEGIWQFDISQPTIIKKRVEFTDAPQVSRIKIANGKVFALSEQKHLIVFDNTQKSSSPLKIKPLKKLPLPGVTHDFQLTDQQLIIIGPAFGIAIADFSQPNKINAQLELQGSQSQLTIHENTAYIADGIGGLVLVDVGSHNKLTWIGSHNKLDSVEKVLVTDLKGYVIDRDIRLASININSKTLPITGSFYMPDGTINDAISDKDYIYLATTHGIEQVSFPNKPHAQISNEGINQGGTRRAFIDNDIAYVADWFSGLHLYDISNPQIPRHLSNYHTPGSSKGVVVEGGYAYVGDDDHGLQIIDVSNPQKPAKVSEVLTTGLAYTLKKVGSLIYLADHRGGFHIIDVTNVKQPQILASYNTQGKSWAIDVVGNIAYVADDSSGLLVFDVSDPRNPILIGQFNPDGYAEDVVIRNNIAYVSFFDKGFYLVDVSNPSKPTAISHLAIPGNARSVVLEGNYAFIAGWESGLNIVDVSDKHSPIIVGNYDTKGSAWGADVYKQHAFVWDWWGGVKVVSVANPTSPRLVGKYHTRGNIYDLRQKGNYIYTANGDGGVQVFDIKNALNPIWATGIDVSGSVKDVWPSHISDHVYAVSDQVGLLVLDVSDPFYIRSIGQYPTGGKARLVVQHKQTIFVANDNTGLTSFNASNPAKLEKIQDIALDVKDMAADHQVLFVASEKQGLIAFEIDKKGQLKKRLKTIDETADHIVADNKLLVSANDHRGITIWKIKNKAYNPVAQLTLDQAILDLHLDGDTLMVATRNNGLMVYDISTPSNPLLHTRYPATDQYGKFIVYRNAAFFGGTHTIASIQLLPRIHWQALQENLIEIDVPATLPIGNYHLAVDRRQGSEQLWPNALAITLQKRSKPKITPEQFQKLLEQYRSKQP